MKLHAPHPFDGLGSAPCGIVALSAILGRDWRELMAECSADGTLLPTGGMWRQDILAILARHGFESAPVHGYQGKATKTWLELPRPASDQSLYMIGSAMHLAVVQGELSVGLLTPWTLMPWRNLRWSTSRRIITIDRIWQ